METKLIAFTVISIFSFQDMSINQNYLYSIILKDFKQIPTQELYMYDTNIYIYMVFSFNYRF